jgi:hypothetical protein
VATLVHRPVLLLVLIVTLAGCGSTDASTKTPQGFAVRMVERPKLSLALPTNWRSFTATARAGDETTHSPKLRSELRVLREPHSPIKLIAVAPARPGKFQTNMNVLQTRVPSSLDFDDLSRNEARQIKLATRARDLRQGETRLPAGRALRLTYRARTNAVVHQYFVRHGDFLYILTYTTSPAEAVRYAKILDLSAHTFKIG